MRVADFDFELPPDRIALRPAEPRDSARLLEVTPHALSDLGIADLPGRLRRGDVLVFNDTRVIPAQLSGTRGQARIGVTLHKREGVWRWWAFVRNARRLAVGDTVDFGHGLSGKVLEKADDGAILWEFAASVPFEIALAAAGVMPLPPYIASKRPADDRDAADYQTMFAREAGAVAAPTAGLHFTPALLAALDAAGIARETVTLHVGAGTFLPVKAEDTDDHAMHAEWGSLDAATAARLQAVRASGGRVIAVGTTSLRVLESAGLDAWSGDTRIFITPGYRFRAVHGLLTNFHLPRSTLFMLVSAMMGLDTMRAAYAHAVAHEYRFYSYGDACLLLPDTQA
ncbi:tRNA preQ1(34) S-adenosylmethionine ribosyltransferase-isomerase QueA [Glacieibacterium frigidum]|uniref:S-adenosylmethionine:tRNA ribosyltransferase-isomerase n=1 Tax=Glacieibacterium frigidum TaxID=2593303 RepID=A0A552UHU4_9SPHN|nr:tRNA preQ1(34) S-adenosylmethionine ribosyltransferase-isomerase QueA [Glacieibacterium frigidum]TRW17796.1 tRNA preQ1(34) S-adenosylmethionine ribosyltransferase-isomerase QueA [Glacieibacterium frigidum]